MNRMSNGIICPSCDYVNNLGAVKCDECGAKLFIATETFILPRLEAFRE